MIAEHPLLPRDGAVVMFLLMRRPDGGPTGYPMTGILRSGQLEFTTYRKAAKARYLLEDNRVCCVVPDPSGSGHGVALYGRAHAAEADAFIADSAGGGEGEGTGPIAVPESVRDTVRDRLQTEKRMVFQVAVERVVEVGDPHGTA